MTHYILAFFLLAVISFTAKAAHDLKDLEILSQEENVEEFFKHALDVRPSQRQEPWKNMVSKMAEVFAQNVLRKSTIEEASFKKTEELFGWPHLKSDDVFKLRRQEIGLKFLKNCLHRPSPCFNHLKSFWEADSKDPETAFKLAELTHPLSSSEYTPWPFLEVALASPLSEFYCKKTFVMTSLWNKLGIDYIRLGPKGDLVKKIDQIIHPDCLPSLNKEAKERLYLPVNSTDRELAYQLLKAQNKANPEISDFFFTVYLLEHPSQGELFNYSWNRLSELGKSSKRRMNVMKEIKKLDPLPDAVFSSLDSTKKKVILNHFGQNFPEYIDHYSSQCLLFYEGKESFPQGNPTVHCQDLMNSDLATPVISEERRSQYLKAREI